MSTAGEPATRRRATIQRHIDIPISGPARQITSRKAQLSDPRRISSSMAANYAVSVCKIRGDDNRMRGNHACSRALRKTPEEA